MDGPSELITAAEAATILRCNADSVRQMSQRGVLPAAEVGPLRWRRTDVLLRARSQKRQRRRVRPMPADFRDAFVRLGWGGIEKALRATKDQVVRWLREYNDRAAFDGKPSLEAARAAYVAARRPRVGPRPRIEQGPRAKPVNFREVYIRNGWAGADGPIEEIFKTSRRVICRWIEEEGRQGLVAERASFVAAQRSVQRQASRARTPASGLSANYEALL